MTSLSSEIMDSKVFGRITGAESSAMLASVGSGVTGTVCPATRSYGVPLCGVLRRPMQPRVWRVGKGARRAAAHRYLARVRADRKLWRRRT